jgi:voltage-gated potassium channel
MTNASSAERGTVLRSSSLVGRAVRSVNASVRQLAQLLLERDGPYSQAFENLILALIVLSLVSVGLETLSGLPAWATLVLKIGEIVVVAVFSFEYLLRIVAAPRKLAFIFSFYGLVDLLAIAPFYLAGLDARYLRALRVLRVLRVLKLQRRVLEKKVAERTHELAERNNALMQAQAQLKA